MNKQDAINFFKQLSNQIFETGTVTLSPKAHSAMVEAINVLESPDEPKKEAKAKK